MDSLSNVQVLKLLTVLNIHDQGSYLKNMLTSQNNFSNIPQSKCAMNTNSNVCN
jgi:hypothetical protein